MVDLPKIFDGASDSVSGQIYNVALNAGMDGAVKKAITALPADSINLKTNIPLAKAVQTVLGIKVDGDAGDGTRRAIDKFLKDNGHAGLEKIEDFGPEHLAVMYGALDGDNKAVLLNAIQTQVPGFKMPVNLGQRLQKAGTGLENAGNAAGKWIERQGNALGQGINQALTGLVQPGMVKQLEPLSDKAIDLTSNPKVAMFVQKILNAKGHHAGTPNGDAGGDTLKGLQSRFGEDEIKSLADFKAEHLIELFKDAKGDKLFNKRTSDNLRNDWKEAAEELGLKPKGVRGKNYWALTDDEPDDEHDGDPVMVASADHDAEPPIPTGMA